jgi:hypothetical protein
MSKFLHGLGHVLLVGLQYANAASGIIPSPYQPIVATALALVQGVLALSHHTAPAPVSSQGSLPFAVKSFVLLALCIGLAAPVAFGRSPQTTAPAVAPKKSTFVGVLAKIPKSAITVLRVGTDTFEYVTGKVATVAAKIDSAADAAESYLANVN